MSCQNSKFSNKYRKGETRSNKQKQGCSIFPIIRNAIMPHSSFNYKLDAIHTHNLCSRNHNTWAALIPCTLIYIDIPLNFHWKDVYFRINIHTISNPYIHRYDSGLYVLKAIINYRVYAGLLSLQVQKVMIILIKDKCTSLIVLLYCVCSCRVSLHTTASS